MKAIHRSAFGIFAAVIVLFAALAVLVARRTSVMMTEEAERTVKSVVKETTARINQQLLAVETVTRNFAWVVGEHLEDPDYMYRITRKLVENNEYIGGSAVAFAPDFYKEKGRFYAPYTCATTNGQLKSFPLPYDYSSREWYDEAKTSGQARWCEPYFDEGGGEVMMCTFSVPLTNETGQVYAVLTADVSLSGMAEYISSICPYPQAYAVMTSFAGKYLVEPPQGRTLERDESAIAIREKTDNGWVVAIICPMEDILAESRRLVAFVVLFAVIGLLIIIPISWIHIMRLQRESVVREWVANKLETAVNE